MTPFFRTVTTTLSLALLAVAGHATEYQAGRLKINQPWTRATPAGMTGPTTMGIGFLVVANTGSTPDTLRLIKIDGIKAVTMHQTLVQNGMVRMVPLADGLPVPAGQTVALQPGGAHLMLAGLSKPLVAGQSLPATLIFDRAGAVPVTFLVEPFSSKGPGDMATGQVEQMPGM